MRHKTDIEVVHTFKTKTTGQMPQRKGMHMSAEDMNKDHLDETRVIDTQAQDAQAPDTHADKTTYVNVAYQKEDGTYEGAWLPADEVVSHEASAKPSWKKKAVAAGAAAAFLVAGFGAGWATSSVASPAPAQQSQAAPDSPVRVALAGKMASKARAVPVDKVCQAVSRVRMVSRVCLAVRVAPALSRARVVRELRTAPPRRGLRTQLQRRRQQRSPLKTLTPRILIPRLSNEELLVGVLVAAMASGHPYFFS